jgi:hypothetical protein
MDQPGNHILLRGNQPAAALLRPQDPQILAPREASRDSSRDASRDSSRDASREGSRI